MSVLAEKAVLLAAYKYADAVRQGADSSDRIDRAWALLELARNLRKTWSEGKAE